MAALRTDATDRRIIEEGSLMEALAEDGAVLTGSIDSLGRRFGLFPNGLRACLLELARAGWISILIQPFGRITVQIAYEPGGQPVRVAGYRSVPAAWRLSIVRCHGTA